MIEIIMGTGDAKHKVYIILPYIIFYNGIMGIKESGFPYMVCDNFVVDTYKEEG